MRTRTRGSPRGTARLVAGDRLAGRAWSNGISAMTPADFGFGQCALTERRQTGHRQESTLAIISSHERDEGAHDRTQTARTDRGSERPARRASRSALRDHRRFGRDQTVPQNCGPITAGRGSRAG